MRRWLACAGLGVALMMTGCGGSNVQYAAVPAYPGYAGHPYAGYGYAPRYYSAPSRSFFTFGFSSGHRHHHHGRWRGHHHRHHWHRHRHR